MKEENKKITPTVYRGGNVGVTTQFQRNRLDLMSNAVIPAKAGAFQSDVEQYKNQIPPNPPFFKGGQIQRFAQIGSPFSFPLLK
jgi:hypothetical protein